MTAIDFDYWVMDRDGNPRRVSTEEYLAWVTPSGNERRIAIDKINGVIVSTVFLAVDHNRGYGPPILFETMTFGKPHDCDCWRYCSKAAAINGHKRVVKWIQDGGKEEDRP